MMIIYQNVIEITIRNIWKIKIKTPQKIGKDKQMMFYKMYS